MLKALRLRLAGWCEPLSLPRAPVIRRADGAAWLLATDLPLLTGEDGLRTVCRQAEAAGWRLGRCANGWLVLDAWEQLPAADLPTPLPEGEIGAALSLLLRHPEDGDPADAIRAIAKAGDAGVPALERCCAALHRTWAAALRRREPLPGRALPCLCAAWQLLSPGSQTAMEGENKS